VSCERASRQAGQAATAAGLSDANSRSGYTAGALLGAATRALDRLGQTTAPAAALALRVVEPTDPQAAKKRAAVGRIAGLALAVGTRAAGLAPVLGKLKLAARVSEVVTSKVGTAVAALSQTGSAGSVVIERRRFLFFKSKQTVALQRSALTGWLNRQDVVGSRQVTANNGATFTVDGKSWHRGTVTFGVGPRQRTVTHLQSLSYPGEHYYFDRSLSNQQAVSLAAGQAKPETLPGFVGRVSQVESLCPAWAGVKRALILAQLHWKDEGKR